MNNQEIGASSARNRITMKYPASWPGNIWREALPSGNGTIGAAVYGSVRSETILINHAALWHSGKKGELPDISSALPGMRGLMQEGRYEEAKEWMTNALAAGGYESSREFPLPLCDLKVEMPARDPFRQYRRTLDLETGEVSVCWDSESASCARVLFVSRTDGVVVYELRAEGGSMDAELRLTPHDAADLPRAAPDWIQSSAEACAEGPILAYAATDDAGRDFGAVLRVDAEGGTVEAGLGHIAVYGARRVLVLLKVFVHGQRHREWPRLTEELRQLPGSYQTLLDRHAAVHRSLFLTAELDLIGSSASGQSNEELLLEAYQGEVPAELVEKMWAFGRYLFVSATAPDGAAFPLYGLWGGDYRLMWSHLMANENVQMMYWQANVGGLSGLVSSLFRHYEGMMDVFRDNARKLFGCRGIFIPAGTTPNVGTPFQTVPVILCWTGAAGWLAQHFYEHYRFTGDRDFLCERALPFMREAALFYEDFFQVGDDGMFVSYPSVSPENTPVNYYPQGRQPLAHPMPTAINATLDFAIAKELLTNLITGSQEAGCCEDELEKWEAMLRRIPPYQINEDGAVKEWMHPDFEDHYHHRHISHIYPVFPGREIARDSSPELFQAFETAVRRRLVIGINDQTSWSLAHLSNIYARLEDGDRALECLELLARSCLLGSLYTVHNDWRNMGVTLNSRRAPVQLDGNMGWVSAVQEMLLYVSERKVKLLPALPRAWKSGRLSGFRLCTGRLDLEWDTQKGHMSAELCAERDTELLLVLPAFTAGFQWRIQRFTQEDEQASGLPHIRIALKPGQRLRMVGVGQ